MRHRLVPLAHACALFTFLLAPCLGARPVKGVGVSPRRAAPRKVALVIGVGRYDVGDITPLPFCVADARNVARALTDRGYQVTRLADDVDGWRPVRANIRRALQNTLGSAGSGPEDLVLVYFSGHGTARKTDDGYRAYLLPADSDPDSPEPGIALSWLFEQLRTCKSGSKVLLLDACHSGSTKAADDDPTARGIQEDAKLHGAGLAILASCKAEQRSYQYAQRRRPNEPARPQNESAFTHFLVEGIQGEADHGPADREVGLGELFTYVTKGVQAWARSVNVQQDPQVTAVSADLSVPVAQLAPVRRNDGPAVRGPNWGIIAIVVGAVGAVAALVTGGGGDGGGGGDTGDHTPPTVGIGSPTVSLTRAGPVTYAITFSEAVTGLAAGAVTLERTGTAAGTVTLSGSGASYTVTVMDISGDGTLAITVPGGAALDAAGNSSAAGSGTAFTVDNTAPTVTTIEGPGQALTTTGPVVYTVRFGEAVTWVSSPALDRVGSADGTLGAPQPTDTTSTAFTATITGITGDGTLSMTIPEGAARDAAGNGNAAAAPGAPVTVDNTPPQVVSATPVDAYRVDVLFSEAPDAGSASAAGNYAISGPLPVDAAVLQADAKTVRLSTAAQAPGATYTLTAAGVHDPLGNASGSAGSAGFGGFDRITLTAASVRQTGGTSGSNLGDYEYAVVYTHVGDAHPAYVRLSVRKPDGAEMGTWEMVRDPADSSFSDGCTYRFRPSILTGGAGAYSFRCETAEGDLRAAPVLADGPTVTVLDPGRLLVSSSRDGDREVYAMAPDGSGPTRVTSSPGDDMGPAWSPDGTRVAFHSARDGNLEIYAASADGTGLVRLTENSAEDSWPAWSPDGARIAFQSNRSGNLDVYVMNADGSGQARLTTHAADDRRPGWSPDGSRLVFYSQRDGNFEIYTMGADGTGQTRLTSNPAEDYDATWSPDGARIAFQSNRDGNYEVYVMDAGGGAQTRLTSTPGDDWWPTWSPDGTRIAYASARDGNYETYVMNADGSGQVRLTDNPAAEEHVAWSAGAQAPAPYSVRAAANPTVLPVGSNQPSTITATVRDGSYRPMAGVSVSFTTDSGSVAPPTAVTDAGGQASTTLTADGTAVVTVTVSDARNPTATAKVSRVGPGVIAFTSIREGNWEIYSMAADGTLQTRLTSHPLHDLEPAWSPDGSRIAFRSSRDAADSTWDIYVMNADGTGVLRLTTNLGPDVEPTWSPDGARVAFTSYRDGNGEVYVMNADGSDQTRLTIDPAYDGQPTWSPDGTRIAWCRRGDIWVMNADGTEQTRLTSSADDRDPAWSPDGTRMAFTSSAYGSPDIFVMNASGGGQIRLTDSTAYDESPTWSPDGTRIAFTSTRDDSNEIYVMNADGTGQTRLTFVGSGGAYDPAWSRGTSPSGRAPTSTGLPSAARLRAACAGQTAEARLTPLGVEPSGPPAPPNPGGTPRAAESVSPQVQGAAGPNSPQVWGAGGAGAALRFVPLTTSDRRPVTAGAPTPTPPYSHTPAGPWEFSLESPDANAETTLSWPNLAALGARERVTLEDLDTGVRRSMRTTAAYTFRGASRRFRVTVEARTGPVLLTGLDVVSGARANGRMVRFTLSGPASVDLDVVSPSGRVVATVARGRASEAGINQVAWPGAAAPGIYLLRATATSEEGTTAQMVRPVVVAR